MNIYIITDEEVFAIAQDLSPFLAKRLCKQYNKQFSGRTQKSPTTPKKLLGDVDTRLQCIVGYFLTEGYSTSDCIIISEIKREDATLLLNKYARSV